VFPKVLAVTKKGSKRQEELPEAKKR